jgi:hypothetical protein
MTHPSIAKIRTEQHAIDCPGGTICRCGVTPTYRPQGVRMVRQTGIQAAQSSGTPSHGGVLLVMPNRPR